MVCLHRSTYPASLLCDGCASLIHHLHRAADVQNMADALIPLPIKFARRPAGVPVGLPNLGNTCYVNCVLQILFHTAPAIVRAVLIWEPPPAAAPNAGGGGGDGARVRRAVEALRLIFVYMICTDRCYVEAHLLDTLRRALGLDETQHDINLIFITLLDTLRIALQTADSDLVGDLYGREGCRGRFVACHAQRRRRNGVCELRGGLTNTLGWLLCWPSGASSLQLFLFSYILHT